jgi:hypothetical protein
MKILFHHHRKYTGKFFLFFLVNRDGKFCENEKLKSVMKIFIWSWHPSIQVYLTFTLEYKTFTLGYEALSLGYDFMFQTIQLQPIQQIQYD